MKCQQCLCLLKLNNSAVDFAGVVVLRVNLDEFNEFMLGSAIR